MKLQLYFLLLLLSFVVFVESESYTEVDENGNEYEVKRFHIQGRQVNDKNQQCVITRKKRSTNLEKASQYSNSDPIFTAEEEGVKNDTITPEDIENVDETKVEFAVMEEISGINQTIYQPVPDVRLDKLKDEFANDYEMLFAADNDKPTVTIAKETEYVEEKPHIMQNQKSKKKEKLQKVTLIRTQPFKETEEAEDNKEHGSVQSIQLVPSSLVSNTAENNYLIIQAQPQSHQADILPALQTSTVLNVMPTDTDYEVQAQLLPFSWSYENQPISTTAIWSTGDDVPNNVYNKISNLDELDYLTIPESEQENEMDEVISRPRPNKHKKNNKKKNSNPTIKPNGSLPNRKIQNNNRPIKQIIRRKHHNRPPYFQANKNRRPNQTQRGQTNKLKQSKKKLTPLAITSETMITTIEDDPQIECIIINKDATTSSTTSTSTTTTTRRPFWNILGRQANSAGQPREYGLRKRTSLRFVG